MLSDSTRHDQEASPDRRRKPRFPLCCRLSIDTGPFSKVLGETTNMSSIGFYGVVDQPFRPGQDLICEIQLPVQRQGFLFGKPGLRCKIVVLRVEERFDGKFGIACMIDRYSFSALPESTESEDHQIRH